MVIYTQKCFYAVSLWAMGRHGYIWALFLLLCFITEGCSPFQRVRKSRIWKEKYQAAVDYYHAGKYAKASLLFEDILPLIRGAKEGEKGLFLYAYAQYYQKQYLIAAEYFKIFAKTYPRTEHTEEASYMHAYMLYISTEPYYLDPNPTYAAVDALQAFLERYPKSIRRSPAQDMIDDLQQRLAKKAFQNAKQYHQLRYYKAATFALKNFQDAFPDSKYIEESEFLRIEAQYKWAQRSVPEKQYERYQILQKSYKIFVSRYPQSTYLSALSALYKQSLEDLQKIATQENPYTRINKEKPTTL